jgi:hypothetical protein
MTLRYLQPPASSEGPPSPFRGRDSTWRRSPTEPRKYWMYHATRSHSEVTHSQHGAAGRTSLSRKQNCFLTVRSPYNKKPIMPSFSHMNFNQRCTYLISLCSGNALPNFPELCNPTATPPRTGCVCLAQIGRPHMPTTGYTDGQYKRQNSTSKEIACLCFPKLIIE